MKKRQERWKIKESGMRNGDVTLMVIEHGTMNVKLIWVLTWLMTGNWLAAAFVQAQIADLLPLRRHGTKSEEEEEHSPCLHPCPPWCLGNRLSFEMMLSRAMLPVIVTILHILTYIFRIFIFWLPSYIGYMYYYLDLDFHHVFVPTDLRPIKFWYYGAVRWYGRRE